MHSETQEITELVLKAAEKARRETSAEPEPENTKPIKWPVECTVGPGLEGAIACETKIGYVNGSKGWLIYRGYDIFDLCANSNFEEVSYLLLHGKLPNKKQYERFTKKLVEYRHLPQTMRILGGSPVEELNTMAALRMGTMFMRQKQTYRDKAIAEPAFAPIGSDEDSIPMETMPEGSKNAVYEFRKKGFQRPKEAKPDLRGSEGIESC
ncbi:MAG: citrate/2-methylcitrate synthase, partial [Planctomycetota bacterium]